MEADTLAVARISIDLANVSAHEAASGIIVDVTVSVDLAAVDLATGNVAHSSKAQGAASILQDVNGADEEDVYPIATEDSP